MRVLVLATLVTLATLATLVLAEKMSKYADPCKWIEFALCKHTTGTAAKSFQLSGFSIKGTEHRMIDDIIAVIPLTTTEDCVLLVTRTASTAVVQGSEDEVLRRLNPEGCK